MVLPSAVQNIWITSRLMSSVFQICCCFNKLKKLKLWVVKLHGFLSFILTLNSALRCYIGIFVSHASIAACIGGCTVFVEHLVSIVFIMLTNHGSWAKPVWLRWTIFGWRQSPSSSLSAQIKLNKPSFTNFIKIQGDQNMVLKTQLSQNYQNHSLFTPQKPHSGCKHHPVGQISKLSQT